ncbi:MAG: hypothetical protein HY904_11670 [Deltaproteobacteria bacterium]|nr:hypothetical protein [Deltaproteobacteria bacterium]
MHVLLALAGIVAAQAPVVVVAVVSTAAPQPALTELEGQLRQAIAQEAGVRAQSAAESGLGLDQARDAGWKCDGAAGCLAQLGTALGADLVVHVALQDGVALLQGVDARKGLVASVRGDWRVDGATRARRLARWGRAVLGRGGTLVLQPTAPVRVRVSGEDIAAAPPVTLVQGLAAGVHVVDAGGKARNVTVAAGASVNVVVTPAGAFLEGETPRNAPAGGGNAMRWAIAGVGGGIAALGVIAGMASVVAAAGAGGLAFQQYSALEHNAEGYLVARAGQTRAEVEQTRNLVVVSGLAGMAAGLVALLAAGVFLVGLVVGLGGAAWAITG